MSKIDDLKEERRVLQLRIGVLDKAISEYEEWERRVELLLPTTAPTLPREAIRGGAVVMLGAATASATGTVVSPPVTPPMALEPQKSKEAEIEEFNAAVDLLMDQIDRPLQRTPLFEALEARGIVVGGKVPLNTLSARMARMDNVVNLDKLGFWRKGRPYPPASYFPEEDGAEESAIVEARPTEFNADALLGLIEGSEPHAEPTPEIDPDDDELL